VSSGLVMYLSLSLMILYVPLNWYPHVLQII
jgi:hypothetical protein